jgi:radical SAM superfamily enzyme YgiQ (UPF0313 family)
MGVGIVKTLIVDALASGRGRRLATLDVIGVGPRAIAGVLETRGLEPTLARAYEVLGGKVDLAKYDMLFVSGMTMDLRAISRVASLWGSESGGPVLVGGPVASEPDRVFSKAKADIAVTGEGEKTLKELVDLGLNKNGIPSINDLRKVRGISYIDDGAIRVNSLRPALKREEYDRFSPSTRVIEDYPLYRSARVYVEVLRGCSNYHRATIGSLGEACVDCDRCHRADLEERYDCPVGIPPGCGYCSVPSLYGPPRSRSVDMVVEEVRWLLKRGVRRIVLSAPGFLDYGRDLLVQPLPLTDPRNPEPNYSAIEELLSGLKELEGFASGKASLITENVKGCLVTEEAARILGRYLGGTSVNIGFETGSEEHSRQLGRPSIPKENLLAVRRLKKEGLKPYAYYIHGLPGQTPATVNETLRNIDMNVHAGVSRIILYRFYPLPMSAFQYEPTAPPAMKDELSRRIYEKVKIANGLLKEKLVGTRMWVVVAEPYRRDRRLHVAYPMLHGPVVLVEGAEGFAGEVVLIQITRIISDRMVRGVVLDGMF